MDFQLFLVVIFAILVTTSWAKQEDSLENDEMIQRLENLERRESSAHLSESFLDNSLEQFRRGTGEVSKRSWGTVGKVATGVAVGAVFGWRRRRSADGTTIEEMDTYKIDPTRKIVIDQISRANGREVTVSDYNLGVMAVVKSDDKVCRIRKLPEEVKRVDLNEQRRYIYALSKAGKHLDLIQDKKEEYQESSRPVTEKDVGSKIASVCKKYKMVWMEPVGQDEKRENTDDQTAQDDDNDAIGDFLGENKAEAKRSRSVWNCGRACNNYTRLRRPYQFCRFQCGWLY